jgi:hypothetical protein
LIEPAQPDHPCRNPPCHHRRGEGMTDSPPGPVHPAEATALEPTITNTPSGPTERPNNHNPFSELNSIRPLDVGLQDLRPLRGRPPADPGPPRLAGVHPDNVGENKIRDNKPTQPP